MNANNDHSAKDRTKYRHLFFDLDHTLWDFESNARTTLKELHQSLELDRRGVTDFERFYKNYLVHNETLWERYRNGTIRQEELRVKRMRMALLDFSIADEGLATAMSEQFLDLLPTRTILFPDTIDVLKFLADKGYVLHLLTNGFEVTQHNKLKHSGLDGFFTHVITSEGSGSLKPHKEIFDFALMKSGATKGQSIMLGDNIEVDIIGAKNAGIDQVYINHTGLKPTMEPTFIVNTLSELRDIF